MFRKIALVLIALSLVLGIYAPASAAPFANASDWTSTQLVPQLEMRKSLGVVWTGTANIMHFAVPQDQATMNFFYLGIEHQTTKSLWLSPQVGVVTGWPKATYECVDLGLWGGWDITPKIDFFGDVEVICGGGLHDYFGHFELSSKTGFGKVGLHFEQTNACQQVGPHVQVKGGNLKLNLGVYAGSGAANARVGLVYTATM
ncbi:MAG: hypothetical protein V1846_04095 [Candidatus Komeilibacteria bacterium]